MAAVRHLPQHLKWFIAAALVLTLSCVLTAQYAGVDQAPDGLISNVLLVKEGDADDAAKLFSADSLGTALPAGELSVPTGLAPHFCTALYMSAAYLVAFIIAPSRAPPVPRSF